MDYRADGENKALAILERIGEVAVTILALITAIDIDVHSDRLWLLILAFILMLIYEGYWIRYFRSERGLKDMYAPFMGIPLAGATLPVAAIILVAIYGQNIPLLIAAVILGIGHIGIHYGHSKELQ